MALDVSYGDSVPTHALDNPLWRGFVFSAQPIHGAHETLVQVKRPLQFVRA